MKVILEVRSLKRLLSSQKNNKKLKNPKLKERIAVNDLSFSAYEGQIYGLLGPNGAGKTTTLRIISTLIKQDSGDAFVDGVSVSDQPEKVKK